MSSGRTKNTPEERRIVKALQELAAGTHKYMSATATANNMSYYKLYGRHNGQESPIGDQNKFLNKAQKASLLQYIQRCDELGRPPKKRYIQQAANSILRAYKS